MPAQPRKATVHGIDPRGGYEHVAGEPHRDKHGKKASAGSRGSVRANLGGVAATEGRFIDHDDFGAGLERGMSRAHTAEPTTDYDDLLLRRHICDDSPKMTQHSHRIATAS